MSTPSPPTRASRPRQAAAKYWAVGGRHKNQIASSGRARAGRGGQAAHELAKEETIVLLRKTLELRGAFWGAAEVHVDPGIRHCPHCPPLQRRESRAAPQHWRRHGACSEACQHVRLSRLRGRTSNLH